MTARTALQHVTRATERREEADNAYRLAMIDARLAGATLQEVADAAGTGRANVLRIVRRNFYLYNEREETRATASGNGEG